MLALALMALAAGCGPPAARTPRAVAMQLCRHPGQVPEQRFTETFRRKVPLGQVRHHLDRLSRELGPCRSVDVLEGPRIRFQYFRGYVNARILLDEEQRITGLWVDRPRRPRDRLATVLAEIQRLPGRTSMILQDQTGGVLAALAPDEALAVASGFKLLVLSAMAAEVAGSRMRWDDVLHLGPRHRSLGPAPLNSWPDGAPLTLQTVARYMIARSDNTATDHLIFHLGRRLVERHAGPRNLPFLSTLEAFKLKSPDHAAVANRYAASKEPGRRRILEELRSIPREGLKVHGRPRHVSTIEWFASVRTMCATALALRDLPALRGRPGLADPRRWKRAAYKGGSEPGVRHVTQLVQHPGSGRWYCLGITWNRADAQVDHHRVKRLAQRLLDLLWRHASAAPSDARPPQRAPRARPPQRAPSSRPSQSAPRARPPQRAPSGASSLP